MTARDYLKVLRENLWTIAATIAVCLAVAGALTVLLPRTYTSTASFYVVAGNADRSANASDAYNGSQLAKERIKSYIELLASPRVLDSAAASLPPSVADLVGTVSASSVDGSVILTVTGEGPSPAEAQAVTAAVAESFVQTVDDLESRGGTQPPAATVQTVTPAGQPTGPTSPSAGLNIGIALFFGVLLGFGVAIGRRTLDRSLRSVSEVEAASGVATLGVVPEDRTIEKTYLPDLQADLTTGGQPRAEAFRRIRTNLESCRFGQDTRVIVVTSPRADDGKSATACGLAASLAAVGARVLLIDGDLRNSTVQSYLGLDGSEGLVGVLTGQVPIQRAVQRLYASSFDVLVAGEPAQQPNELLSSRAAHALISDARSRYDFVIVDSPPVLSFADAIGLGRYADGAVVVCRWSRTTTDDLEETLAALRGVSMRVVGTILSRVPATRRRRRAKAPAVPRQRSAPTVETPRTAGRGPAPDTGSIAPPETPDASTRPPQVVAAGTTPDDAGAAGSDPATVDSHAMVRSATD